MEWTFFWNYGFYGVLGIVLAVPLVTIIASLRHKKYADAWQETVSFLGTWARVVPNKQWTAVTGISCGTGVLLLLAFFAFLLNRAGDATMPLASRVANHFGNTLVEWSIDHKAEWKKLIYEFRELNDLPHEKRREWEIAKARLGKVGVRLFRVTFFMAVLLLFAGLLDLRSTFWRRGIVLVICGLIAGVASTGLWVERQAQYIENLSAGYRSKYASIHDGEEAPLASLCPNFPKQYTGD